MREITALLPESLHWLIAPHFLATLVVVSVIFFVASLVGVPWFLARMPPDYFSRREQKIFHLAPRRRPAWYLLAKVGKNALGLLLLLLGVAMLFLPGQGLVTIFVSLVLLDFPGKRRLQRRIVSAPAVLRAINALRLRAGKPPMIVHEP